MGVCLTTAVELEDTAGGLLVPLGGHATGVGIRT